LGGEEEDADVGETSCMCGSGNEEDGGTKEGFEVHFSGVSSLWQHS
jgi:hypothetical protein